MADAQPLVSLSNFALDPWLLPQLEVARGEHVCVHIPEGEPADVLLAELALIDALTARGFAHAEPPSSAPPGCFRIVLGTARALPWFMRAAKCDRGRAEVVLRGLGVANEARLGMLDATTRMVMGVHAALERATGIVLTTMGGLDPTGMFKVHELVGLRIADGRAAVHVSVASTRGDRFCPARRCVGLVEAGATSEREGAR